MAVIYHQSAIVLALLFVTFPFVVRSVQPVLLALDLAEEEAAATLGAGPWTTFRRVTLPAIMPAILTGAGLSLSRALGEFGSVVMVAGNRPMSTKTAPLYIFGEIESGHRYEAMAISIVLLAASLACCSRSTGSSVKGGCNMATEVMVQPSLLTGGPRGTLDRWLLIASVLCWFAILILVPAMALVSRALRGGLGSFLAALATPEAIRAFALTLRITATRHGFQHRLWGGIRPGAGAASILGPVVGRWHWWTCRLPSRR